MSVNLDDCLQYIIGLSRTECECFEAGKPADYNASDSGIFLDELPGLNLNMIDAARDCSANSIWNKMINARDQAVKEFKHDLLSCIVANTRLKRQPFSGVIGDSKKFTKDITVNTTYAGVKIRLADIIGGFAKLKRIGMVFNATSTIDILVYNNLSPDIVATYNGVPTVAGKLNWFTLPAPLEIDMNSDSGQVVEYYFIYQYSALVKPKDTKFSCNCGGYHPTWNDALPQYNSYGDKGNFGWAQFAMAQGIKGNDISDLTGYPNTWSADGNTYGLMLDMQFGCKAEKTICNDQLDYISNPFAMAMAYAVRFKAGQILLNDIMTTSEPNYYTVLASELLPQYAKQYREEYEDRVKLYLCKNIADPANLNNYSDCFMCKEEYGFTKAKLLN